MMYHSPFFNYPYTTKSPNSYYRYHYQASPIYKQSQTPKQNTSPSSIIKEPEKDKTEEIFELFGIKLYFDDILLICLLFFLYKEGVKDQYLFISLVLLLLS